MSKKYLPHSISELFPRVSPAELAELVEDISKNGLQNPITLFEGKILDGRHRYDACGIAEVEPRFVEYEGKDPLGFVLSGNLNRRHLTTSQRAMIAAKLADIKRGGDRKSDEYQSANLHFDRESAAEKLNVSRRSVNSASKVLDESPKLAAQVQAGEITVNKAKTKIAEGKKTTPPQEEKVELDKVGRPIPKKILDNWNRATQEGKDALDLVSKVRCALKNAQEEKDIIYREVNFSSTIAQLNNAYADLNNIVPYAVCNVCQGQIYEKCGACKGRGFLSKFTWDICVPSEFKNLFTKKK